MIVSGALIGTHKELSTTYWTVAIIEIMYASLPYLMHGNGPCTVTYSIRFNKESGNGSYTELSILLTYVANIKRERKNRRERKE